MKEFIAISRIGLTSHSIMMLARLPVCGLSLWKFARLSLGMLGVFGVIRHEVTRSGKSPLIQSNESIISTDDVLLYYCSSQRSVCRI